MKLKRLLTYIIIIVLILLFKESKIFNTKIQSIDRAYEKSTLAALQLTESVSELKDNFSETPNENGATKPITNDEAIKVVKQPKKDSIMSFDIPREVSTELNNDDISQWMKNMAMKYKKVNENIHYVCKKYHIQPKSKMLRDNLLVDQKHRLATCWHAKVGSSQLIEIYKRLLPLNKRETLKNVYEDRYEIERYFRVPWSEGGRPEKVQTINVKKYIKSSKITAFSLVRHPFERLVSAYKNKVLHDNGKYIRGLGYENWYKTGHSFANFVDLVLKEYENFSINEHWRPFSFKCAYCEIQYDVIGQLDTFQDDVKYLVLKNRLEKVIPITEENFSTPLSMMHTKNLTLTYFSKMSKSQKEKVYEMYKIDFEMFTFDSSYYL